MDDFFSPSHFFCFHFLFTLHSSSSSYCTIDTLLCIQDYKKRFGESRNAVKRKGYGPEVGVTETTNSNKEVLKRRLLSTEGVFGMNEKTMAMLNRKHVGGIKTKLDKRRAEEDAEMLAKEQEDALEKEQRKAASEKEKRNSKK